MIASTLMSAKPVFVRPALPSDAAAIARIYNQGIERRVATFETRLRTADDILPWFVDARHPLLVAERGRAGLTSPPASLQGRGEEGLTSPPPPLQGRGEEDLTSPPAPLQGRGEEGLTSPPAPLQGRGEEDLTSPPASLQGRGEEVVGWIHASDYRPRECYAGIGEFSVYVADEAHGMGVGSALMAAFLPACAEAGLWKVLSRIFVENEASRALCAKHGFREVGIYKKHAQLDGVWKDCVIVERLLP